MTVKDGATKFDNERTKTPLAKPDVDTTNDTGSTTNAGIQAGRDLFDSTHLTK